MNSSKINENYNSNLLSWLLSTGLDEQRAKIYLSVLSMGEASAKKIADNLGLRRTAIYDNLKFLEKRGYITIIKKGKRKFFVPLHPKELYKKINSQKQQLKDLLPDFLAAYATDTKQPFVQLFSGKYAAREIYEDILENTKDEYIYISPPQLTLQTVDKIYIKNWIKRRVKKGIKARALRMNSGLSKLDDLFLEEQKYLRQIRYLPSYIDLKATIYVYKNNVGVISTEKEGVAFIIQSPDLAHSLKQLFNFLWGISKGN